MAIYTVHAPPDLAPDTAAERMVFVKDGFSWPALFVPVLWLLYRRLWLGLLVYAAFIALVLFTDAALGDTAARTVAILGAILFALEANDLRRAKLNAQGWREAGEAVGRNLAEAEFRYFHARAARSEAFPPPEPARRDPPPAVTQRPAAPRRFTPPRHDEPHVLGLFPERDA